MLIFSTYQSISQKKSPLEILGDASVENGDWYTAHAYYEQAFLKDTTEFDITVKYAESLRMVKDYNKALYYYEKLYGKDRGKKFKESQFWIAEIQKMQGQYSTALRNFKKFKKKARKDKESYFYKKTEKQIESCVWANNQRIDSTRAVIAELDNKINTDESEFGSFLYNDSILFYNSLKYSDLSKSKEAKVKIYKAKIDTLNQVKKHSEFEISKDPVHQANITFSKDRTKAFYCLCDSIQICKLFESKVDPDGNWSDEKELSQLNTEDYTSTMPFLAYIKGQEVLFFVSDRPGGKGKLDIWWSEFKNGNFDKPINASDKINTPDNEISPFYLGHHLYFSSEWHNGFGALDIFKAEGHPRSFKKPENLGFPINSSWNDLYYSYYTESDQGFFTSNRVENIEDQSCCNDLFTFHYPDSLVQEIDSLEFINLETLNKYLPVTLYFHNDEPNPNSWETSTQLSYLEAYESYKNLEETYKRENSKGLSQSKKEEAIFDVEDFYNFNVDKGVQDLEIFSKLLLQELQLGTSIELSVRGFASPRAKSDYNVNLTKRRISSMVNYLKEYENGVYRKYLNNTSEDGGSLKIIEIPFGEYKADQDVSDVIDNEKESIYSRGARMERKIEIMSVQRIIQDSIYSKMDIEKEVFDFGQISPLRTVYHSFKFENTGNEVLYIDSIDTECGCTIPEISKTTLQPGETSQIDVSFNPKGKQGLVSKTITIYTSESDEPKKITITAEIE